MPLCIAQSGTNPLPPAPALLPEFRPRNATSMSVPWPVVDEKQRTWACGILDVMRPGHSLRDPGFVAWDIEDEADARDLADFLWTVDWPVGFDFETAGWTPEGAYLPNLYGGVTATDGVSALHPKNQARPAVFQVSWGRDSYLVRGRFLRHFAAWLMSDRKIDYANAGFEFATCTNVGFTPTRVHRDCLDMDFALAETTRQYGHNLKAIEEDYLGYRPMKFKELPFKKGTTPDYEAILQANPGMAIAYAATDPLGTTLGCDILEHLLRQEADPVGGGTRFDQYMHMERGFHGTMFLIERSGLPVSRRIAKQLDDAIHEKLQRIDAEWEKEFGKGAYNPMSLKDLAKLFYGKYGLPVRRTTNASYCLICSKQVSSRTQGVCNVHGRGALLNREGVDESVLESMAEDGIEIASRVSQRRGLAKQSSTYLDPLARLSSDGRAFPVLRSNFVVSGRLSGDVFLTTPKDLRLVFAFEDEGDPDPWRLLRFDYSQLELRVLAHLANDRTMLNAFRNRKDLHCFAAGLILLLRECPEEINNAEVSDRYYAEMKAANVRKDLVKTAAKLKKDGLPSDLKACYFKLGMMDEAAATPSGVVVPPLSDREKMCIALRDSAKAVNFGLAYGMSASRYARAYGTTIAEAQSLFDLIWSLYADVQPYYQRATEEARRRKGLYTLLGRHKELPQFESNDPAIQAFAERLVKNTPCQGGAADIIRLAMIAVAIDLEAGGPPTPSNVGAFGYWRNGRYEIDYTRVPAGWRKELPKALQTNLGLLGQLGVKMQLQVHDELLFGCRQSRTERASQRIKEIMEHPGGGAMALRVPLEVSSGSGSSWSEAG